MNSKSNVKLQFANLGLAMALLIAGSAIAQTLPKEGSYDVIACWSGVANRIDFSKTHWAFSFEMTGTLRSNPPGGMFDNMSFRCVGVNSLLGGKAAGTNVCESVDRDGDKRMTYLSGGAGVPQTRETVAGTGKYEGMVESGNTAPLGPFPAIKPGEFQSCNHQTGTYKLK